jgi:hypothetical protein
MVSLVSYFHKDLTEVAGFVNVEEVKLLFDE